MQNMRNKKANPFFVIVSSFVSIKLQIQNEINI